jgi:ABC-type lipoprotein export system ATPase subunit
MIQFKAVTKIYPAGKASPVTAVNQVNLAVENGEFLIITGRSGSGKTTLLNLAAGLTWPSAGEVLFDGVNLGNLPDLQQSQLRNQKMGFIFQFPSLIPTLTVLENVVLPASFGGKSSRQGVNDRAVQTLEKVELADKLNVHPRQLSAGQQQRVVIARALINQPEVLLADEPTSNLDEKTEMEIMGLFRQIHSETGVTIMMVTHTSQLVPYGTRTIVMGHGEIVG